VWPEINLEITYSEVGNFSHRFITSHFSPAVGFSGFMLRVFVKCYEFVNEPTASIFRVTVTVEMDTQVIRRKQMCLLLSTIKSLRGKLNSHSPREIFCQFPASALGFGQTPQNLSMELTHFLSRY
jgi:hypothetical protein